MEEVMVYGGRRSWFMVLLLLGDERKLNGGERLGQCRSVLAPLEKAVINNGV